MNINDKEAFHAFYEQAEYPVTVWDTDCELSKVIPVTVHKYDPTTHILIYSYDGYLQRTYSDAFYLTKKEAQAVVDNYSKQVTLLESIRSKVEFSKDYTQEEKEYLRQVLG